jgi:hypothetical protein
MPFNMIITGPTVSTKHFPLLVLLIGLSSQSICAQCRSTSSDTSFAALGSTTGYSQEFHGDGAPSYLRVTRVVGPGTGSEFSANGTPKCRDLSAKRGRFIEGLRPGFCSDDVGLELLGTRQYWGISAGGTGGSHFYLEMVSGSATHTYSQHK